MFQRVTVLLLCLFRILSFGVIGVHASDKPPWEKYAMDRSTYERLTAPELGPHCEFFEGGHAQIGPNFRPYMEYLRQRVESRWKERKGGIGKPIKIRLKTYGDGSLSNVTIEKSAASAQENQNAVETIKGCAPLGPFPPGAGQGPVEITLSLNVDPRQVARLSELNSKVRKALARGFPLAEIAADRGVNAGTIDWETYRKSGQAPSKEEWLEGMVQAEEWLKESIAVCEKAYGEDFPETRHQLSQLARVYRQLGKTQEEERTLRRIIKLGKGIKNPTRDQWADLVVRTERLGDILAAQGRHNEAELMYSRCIAILEGKDRSWTRRQLDALGDFYDTVGQSKKAEQTYKRAVSLIWPDNPYRPDPTFSGTDSLDKLAEFYYKQGRFAEAEAAYKRELALYESLRQPFGFSTDFKWFSPYVALLRKQNRSAEADEVEKKVKAIKAISGSFRRDGTPLFREHGKRRDRWSLEARGHGLSMRTMAATHSTES